MILSDLSLWKLLDQMVSDPDPGLVNPASIDVRLGDEAQLEVGPDALVRVDLRAEPVRLAPGDFAVAVTHERITVPMGHAVELVIKPDLALQGYELASVWLEPGSAGVGPLALRNRRRHTSLPLTPGMRIAELVVHRLDQPAARAGRGHAGIAAGRSLEGVSR